MVFTVDYGHALIGSVGARGNGYKEEEENRIIGRLVTNKLRSLGHTVHEVYLDNAATVVIDINHRVNSINTIKPDLSISIHMNAFGDAYANGVEVWCKDNSKDKAQKIVNEIANLGFRNRGVKDGAKSLGLVGLYGSGIPALLVECCFITNKEDMEIYNPEKIATAIVKGITDIDTSNNTKETDTGTETKIKEYPEIGIFTCTTSKIFFRNKPFVAPNNEITGFYARGEKVNYDYVVITNKYVWISWVSISTGIRRYMPITDRITGERWGNCV